jgi:aconitate hydratase
VLAIAELLRAKGVVGRFVEFFGAGLANLPLADRATIGNMSPEFGSTVSIFPIDAETLRYLEFTGRPEQIELVEAYAREQGLWHDEHSEQPVFSDTSSSTSATIVPSIAGPRRPQDRVLLSESRERFHEALSQLQLNTPEERGRRHGRRRAARARPRGDRRDHELHQHLEPRRDDRRRPAGSQRGRAGCR